MRRETAHRYLLIGSLYVSQGVPLGFFTVAVPAILRGRGVSLEVIGLISAVALPWLLKFLWAPLVDGWGSRRLGQYRSWLFPAQALSVACCLIIALLTPERDVTALVLTGLAFMLLSATQDIATDGLAVRSLRAEERGLGNGIQVGGYYLGQILGGAAVLVIFSRFGWTTALFAVALFLALPFVPLVSYREPPPTAAGQRQRPDYRALARFFKRPGIGTWVAVLVLYRAGEQMAIYMLNPLLVDRGYSMEQIGLTLGVVLSAGSLVGSMAGGGLVNRLGRKTSLIAFCLLQAAALGAFQLPATGFTGLGLVAAVVSLSAFTGGMATAALYTSMMDRCRERDAGTDFTIQQCLCAIGPLIGSSVSGFSAAALGYGGHFLVCAGVSLLAAGLIFLRLEVREPVRRMATA